MYAIGAINFNNYLPRVQWRMGRLNSMKLWPPEGK